MPKAQKARAKEFDNRGHNGPSEESKNIKNRLNEAIDPPVGKWSMPIMLTSPLSMGLC